MISGAQKKNKRGTGKMPIKKSSKHLKRKRGYCSSEEEDVKDSIETEASQETQSDDEETVGNKGWADAMSKILSKSLPSKKTVILAQAKKDQDKPEVPEAKQSEDAKEVIQDKEQQAELEPPPKIYRSQLNKKNNWESLGRKKVDPTEKDYERNLARIATRGVVQLFNAVEQQQKTLNTKLKTAGASEKKREVVFKEMDKGAFLDLLKGTTGTKQAIKQETTEKSSTWNALREDFMLGAKMKDWDKEDETFDKD